MDVDTVDDGLDAGFGGGLRRLATNRLTGGADGDSVEDGGTGGGRAVGGFGADAAGGSGRVASESDRYAASRFAPVSTPPRLRSFGMPPANKPPSWGADGTLELLSLPTERPSLLLRNRFPPGTGGASPPGGLGMPGTGGAPPMAGPLDFPCLSIIGADLSFVTVFLSFVPLVISCNRALCADG